MTESASPALQLSHGTTMPQLGLGTSPMNDAETELVVADAVRAGYRLIDTAENYRNEKGAGRGIRAGGVPREQLFVTTKFNAQWHDTSLVATALDNSLARLGTDYVDLLLIHWPNPEQDRYVQAWEGMVAAIGTGKVKAIGTSNFKPAHLDRIIDATGYAPDVNQIQLSPAVTRTVTRSYDREHGIVTQSWSPLGGRRVSVLGDPVVTDIAQATGRTPAQVVLRWHVQLGLAAVPKSADPTRLRQNLDVFDFSLSESQVSALSGLDQGEGAAVDSDAFGH